MLIIENMLILKDHPEMAKMIREAENEMEVEEDNVDHNNGEVDRDEHFADINTKVLLYLWASTPSGQSLKSLIQSLQAGRRRRGATGGQRRP